MNAPLKLQVTPTAIHDVLVIEPKVFGDERGWFTESFNAQDFSAATGLNVEFVQDNHSFSRQWTLRGLHYQLEQTQTAEFLYKTTDYYHPQSEACLAWNDPQIKIVWPLPEGIMPNMNAKDSAGLSWDAAPKF